MEKLFFYGPFKFSKIEENLEIADKCGVYIWCVKLSAGTYRVYYVGEAQNLKIRMKEHLKKHRKGLYTCHSLDGLKANIKILMHRPEEGMIPRYSHFDKTVFLNEFIDDLYYFYSPLSPDSDKALRCRYETAIATQIENFGQNILSIGHRRYWKNEKMKVFVDTGSVEIEALTNETLDV